ncbi:hypothetical protein [Cytobacillus oceanisediminis]|uniref:hypothetical protein n=1 Tax=Cytobacillus oceanisediminis TaxID=665099 RepID=UPI001FB56B4D|nr:hypothetical protein [Cytobacillus oceanisediminis]UOE58156.1 hypothetical protein IRB79_26995 [Cytobacillus oceanisediminis]
MLNKISVHDVRNKLTSYIICSKYEIDDMNQIMLDDAIYEEDDERIVRPSYELMDQLFPFEYEEIIVPDKLYEDLSDGCFYYINAAIFVPGILPLLKDDNFVERLTVSNQGGCGHSLEFVYLPTSDFSGFADTEEDIEIYQNFGNQEGCFILAIQDEGYHQEHDYMNFYMEVRALGLYISKMIKEHTAVKPAAQQKERGVLVA